MRKPIKSPLYFEARFRVRGKVLESIMCPHCEKEGELYVRVARAPGENWAYDPTDSSSFVDIIGFDSKGAYLQIRPGDWVEADIICFGYLRRIRASAIEIEGNSLASGSRKVGKVSIEDGRLAVDFSVFKANLAAQSEEEMAKVLKRERIRDGSFVETDCSVDIDVKTIGHRGGGTPEKQSRHRRRS